MHVNTLPWADTSFITGHADATGHHLCWYSNLTTEPATHCDRRAGIHFLAEHTSLTTKAYGEALTCSEHFVDSTDHPDRSTWAAPICDDPVIAQHPYARACGISDGFFYDEATSTWVCAGAP